jgi:glycosyltransferase involved in cell wall biosynthesis
MPGLKNYITDEEVVALRKAARLYVFPSLKEGFSLTPLEAQAIGLPCLISDIPCHREIYGDSVAYFDPNNVGDMVNSINKILEKPNNLIDKGYLNSSKYNWYNTGVQTCSIIKQAVGIYYGTENNLYKQ